MNLEDIKSLEFKYYDTNGYIYPFVMLEGSSQVNNDKLECTIACTATNLSANAPVSFYLKKEEDKLFFKTDYFANNEIYTILQKDGESYIANFSDDSVEVILKF